MFQFLFKKENQVEELIFNYLDTFRLVIEHFNKALVVSLSLAVTIHIYTMIGVPVSSSQAVIGSVLGIGVIKGARAVRIQTLKRFVLTWVFTPMVACIIALTISFISRLRYLPPL